MMATNLARPQSTRTAAIIGVVALALLTGIIAPAEPVTLASLLREMTDHDNVARFPQPEYQCLQASSYNRASTNRSQPNQDTTGWYADSDGLGFIRAETRNGQTEWVIMEHQGPGCLTSLWTPYFYYGFQDRHGPHVRIYLDGQPEPLVDEGLIELVTGKGSIPPPFSRLTARAGDSYLPIPFARSCKVTMAAKPFYYHINYRAYAPGTQVDSLTRAALHSAAAELEKTGQILTALPDAARGAIQDSAKIAAGAKLDLQLPAGPTALRQLALRVPSAVDHPEILRSTILSMTFDGEQTVWCPLGDFFCSADALHPFHTWQRTVSADGTLVCRWVMPYKETGTVQILNLGTTPVDVRLQADVGNWHWDERSMHFQAHWRPDNVVAGTPFQDWNFVDIRGRGVYVGDAWTVLNIQGSWWGEGDEKIYVDQAWDQGFPTHFGTGTEDYYGWAGGEVPTRKDEFSAPFLANARVGGLDGRTTGFNICTRTRSLDAIPFHERLVFDMESSFGTDIRNPWNLLGYSAVTFWYAKPGASHNRPPQPAQAAHPVMALADLKARADAVHDMLRQHEGEPAVVFTEHREEPLRPGPDLAANWPVGKPAADPEFSGVTKPGEFFVFQLGVYAVQNSGPLGITFTSLSNSAAMIPAGALRCLSLGGTNYQGRPFVKELFVPRGQLQPLWVGVAVPKTVQGEFSGTAQLQVAPGKSVPIKIKLRVEGPPVTDAGDSVAKNLSRLRWLDSTVGSDDRLPKPFIAVKTKGRRIQVLGRELELTEAGLPARIASHFSPANTRLEKNSREVLSQPMTLEIETLAGLVSWQHQFGKLQRTDWAAAWTATGTADGLRTETQGRLDATGSGEIRIQLTAVRDCELKDARLNVPFRQDVARYFMGLHQPGGRLPESVHWKWDVQKRQDCFWLGDVNAGLMLRFKDADYLRPPVNIYYSFRPLRLPQSWGNEGRGGIDIEPRPDHQVRARAYSGPRLLKQGQSLDFIFELYLTPFRPIDTEKQWATRFVHVGGPGRQAIDQALTQADARRGPNVLNVHHASFYTPYINYPYSDDSFPVFRDLVQRAHQKGIKLRVYYTTREITQNMPELFPLHAFNGEVIFPGPGKEARTLLHPHGPHPWLTENLHGQFVPAWEAQVGAPYADLDLSVLTTPDSRWNNFYLEGLRWLVDKSDFDGVYIDDTALDATSLRRARRILDSRPGRLIDLHTWNHFNGWAGYANNLTIYAEILPFLDRLWLGEGFDAGAVSPDYWLVEMSGLPFGLMSEMLDGANPWRGMVFGETARLPWSGDPRSLWHAWDAFGIQGTEMLPFFLKNCPVQTGQTNVLATVYRAKGHSLVALGSWAAQDSRVNLQIDWKALGLNPARARVYAPAISGVQNEQQWSPGESIPVTAKRGWFLVLDEGVKP